MPLIELGFCEHLEESASGVHRSPQVPRLETILASAAVGAGRRTRLTELRVESRRLRGDSMHTILPDGNAEARFDPRPFDESVSERCRLHPRSCSDALTKNGQVYVHPSNAAGPVSLI